MGQINTRRVFLLAGTSALILVYLILWVKMINDPAQRTGSDFIALYSAGRVAETEGFSKVFNPFLTQAVQEQVVGFQLGEGQVLLYNHVPFLVPLLSLIVGDNYLISFLAWCLISLLIFLGATALLARLFNNQGWMKSTTIESWLGLITFFPLFVSLMNGQDTTLTTLGLCLWFYGLLTRRMWLAGLGLALVTIRPQIALFLAVPFLFRYRQVFLWFCAGAIGLVVVSWLSVGWDGMQNFVQLLLVSAGGNFYGLKESAMVNLVGWLLRRFPGWNPQVIHWIGWISYFSAMITLCIIWIKNRTLDERHFGMAVCIALFFSPHLHYHDSALLLVPISCLMIYLSRNLFITSRTSALFPLATSLFLLLGSLVPGVKNDLPFMIMVFLSMSPWLWMWFFSQKKSTRQELG